MTARQSTSIIAIVRLKQPLEKRGCNVQLHHASRRVEIIALTDMSFPFPMPLNELWPQVSPDAWKPYRERYPDTFHNDQMLIEIGCYFLRSQGQSILIDTGYGPGPIESIGGLEGQLMLNLARENIDPKEVDTVFLSHLHSDHVGWNTVEVGGELVPAFPNARYIVHQADLDHFRKPSVQEASSFPFMDRSVERLVDLGLLDTITKDTDITALRLERYILRVTHRGT